MKSIKEMDVKELGAYICSHLQKYGIEITLTGGSCVTIYSQNQYVSMDLDFVETYYTKRNELKKHLKEIGFIEKNRYFKHPETELFIEFPPGPLAVGEEAIKEIEIIKTAVGELRIISPTECVKDRLASFYFWNDRQCLNQAVMVAKHNKINLSEVKRWSTKEGETEKFNEFISLLDK
ncbi:MAG: hypothetical protein K9N09_11845 [Candidatus Cloacimonetes bacterium]|nr:hypothetical protein [Candidatus Cloacimonadota bacterium]MCF7815165.1 hypothetical protein [Candidatus Cloacimonadota bacterium]MCF7869377.1 hypothetical protein [Candidatus Cloacimonadota bacterium]MCF7884779.1 hypothetical protein [Candidatus Cloacimonadota bacterium]